jgi:hypothetical protein
MSGETARLLARVAQRAKDDPDAVLPTLRVLAGEPPYARSTKKRDLHALALEINRARLLADQAEFVAHSWTAEQVAAHLNVKSRQAVAQRRQRGTLVGAVVGNQTYYPDWQFAAAGLAPDLDRLLALFRCAGIDDAHEIDEVLRMPHSELRGRTLLAAWRRADWTTLGIWLGDMSGWRR